VQEKADVLFDDDDVLANSDADVASVHVVLGMKRLTHGGSCGSVRKHTF
jgi:hypothetical protein